MTRIVIGDSSAVVRSIEKEVISNCRRLSFGGDAATEESFISKISSDADGFILDANLLKHYTLESTIKHCMKFKIPGIIFTSQETKCLTKPRGIDIIKKPAFSSLSSAQVTELSGKLEKIMDSLKQELLFNGHMQKVAAAAKDSASDTEPVIRNDYKAILVGVSTGGPATLMSLLKSLEGELKLPLLITQHIDSTYDRNLISWLNANVSMPVQLAENNQVPLAGSVYFAPSDVHLTLAKSDNGFKMVLNHDPEVNFLRPSVDKMLFSAAEVLGPKCITIILTGMGSDGAQGCLKIKELGGYTITQDEESCVVYGMPKAAYEAGASLEVLPLEQIGKRIKELCEKLK